MSADSSRWVGHELANGRYWITAQLGEGGMGVVYRALDRNLETEVVIKVPRHHALANGDLVRRFSREIRSLVRLSHPHVAKVLDVGEYQELPFAVLQFLGGGNLKDRQPRDPAGKYLPMPVGSLSDWLDNVATALDFIHGQNYVHRDVKPLNILFDAHGNAYLSDFGLAKGLEAIGVGDVSGPLTGTGMFIGTVPYMAPELFANEPYDGRVDQYALACTVYELLAGRLPIEGGQLADYVMRRDKRIPDLHELAPGVPQSVSQAIRKALSVNPGNRFPSCTALARAVLGTGVPSAYDVAPEAPEQSKGESTTGEKVRLQCPACQRPLRLGTEMRGRKVRCSACRTPLRASADLRQLTLLAPAPVPPPPPPAAPSPTHLPCPNCTQTLRLLPEFRGKQIRCGVCQAVLTVAEDLRQLTVGAPPTSWQPATAPAPAPWQPPPPAWQSAPAPPSAPWQPPPPLPDQLLSPVDQVETSPTPQGQQQTPASPQPLPAPPRRRKRLLIGGLVVLTALLGAVGAWLLWPKGPSNLITRDNVITGIMTIDFGTRSRADAAGKPPADAQDTYTADLRVRTEDRVAVHYAGTIVRRVSGDEAGPAALRFQLSVTAQQLDASGNSVEGKSKAVGTLSGDVPVTAKGKYQFADHLAWTSALGGKQLFGGEVQGKVRGEKGKKADNQRELIFNRSDGLVKFLLKDPDPMLFEGLYLPGDGTLGVAAARLKGELTFDYDSSSYLTDDLSITYDAANADRVQGTIIWKPDATYDERLKGKDLATEVKSQYVFNLVFNPGKQEGGTPRLFTGEEKDLVVVDRSMAALTGSISYVDEGKVEQEGGKEVLKPYRSQVTYQLHAQRLTVSQVHTFLKMWLLMSGPVNDE